MTREQASQLFADMLALMHTHRASDLFITADFPPALKIDGVITKASPQSFRSCHVLHRHLPPLPVPTLCGTACKGESEPLL